MGGGSGVGGAGVLLTGERVNFTTETRLRLSSALGIPPGQIDIQAIQPVVATAGTSGQGRRLLGGGAAVNVAAVLLPNASSGNWVAEGQGLVQVRLATAATNKSAGLQVRRAPINIVC